MNKKRCAWAESNPLFYHYHDYEWGTPLHDDRQLFEFLILETFQSGLSWAIVFKKRANFRKVFDQFDYEKIASYTENKVEELIADKGIIRNKLKIRAVINNAQAFLRIRSEFGSFNEYIWNFVHHAPIQNNYASGEALPAKTALSDKISTDLKKRGFKFIGSTVVYAHMQATGMVNDHTTDCYRHKELL